MYDKGESVACNLMRMVCTLMFGIVVSFVCLMIRILTFTFKDGHKVTPFKIWRIRRFTALKLLFYRKMPGVCRWLRLSGYLENLNNRVGRKNRKYGL